MNKKIRDFEESREIPPGTQASHPPVAKIPKIISDASKHFQDFISPIIELLSFLESNIESLSTIEDSKTRELYVDNLLYPSQMALDWIDKEKETENTNSDRTGDLNILVLAFLVVLQLNSLLLCVLPSSGPFLDLVQDFIAIVKSNEKELQLSQKKGVLGFITDANPENITKGYQSIEQFKV